MRIIEAAQGINMNPKELLLSIRDKAVAKVKIIPFFDLVAYREDGTSISLSPGDSDGYTVLPEEIILDICNHKTVIVGRDDELYKEKHRKKNF